MTRIFAADRRQGQRGLTLLELLIALALAALVAGLAAGGLRASSPQMHVKLTAEQLFADLKRARGEADITGAPVSIVFDGDGYGVEALRIERTVPAGVEISVDGGGKSGSHEIIFRPGFAARGRHIVIQKLERRSEIVIDPITRRISLK